MSNLVNRVFRLQDGETKVVLLLGLILLSNSMARQVSGIVAISGFLDTSGINEYLIVLAIDYLIILLTGALSSLIIDRFDRINLVRWTAFGFAMVFVALRLMFVFGAPEWLNYSLLYLMSEQQWVIFPLFFWVLANDMFEMAQAKRLFPLIGSWSFMGNIIGVGFAFISPSLFLALDIKNEEVLTLNALIYLVVFVLVTVGMSRDRLRETTQEQETMRETLTEGWEFVRDVPSFRFLTLSIMALAIADTIIEFRFLGITDAAYPTAESYQQFYSLYRMAAIVIAFVIQVTITSRLIDRLQLKNTFFAFPLVALSAAIWMIITPGVAGNVGAMLVVKLVRDTVSESSRKSFLAVVPEERRGRVSLFLESYVPAVGTIAGCLAAGVVVIAGVQLGIEGYHYGYLAIAAGMGAFAIWAISRMRFHYDSSLLNWRLKRRRRGKSVLDKLDF